MYLRSDPSEDFYGPLPPDYTTQDLLEQHFYHLERILVMRQELLICYAFIASDPDRAQAFDALLTVAAKNPRA